MEFEKTKFLNKKENSYGVYYGGKIGDDFINITENKDGTLKIKIGKDLFTAKPTASGKGHTASIDGDMFFFGTGSSKFGEYMKMSKLPPRDSEGNGTSVAAERAREPNIPPKQGTRQESAPAKQPYYGGKKFKS
jgi:hypothetical protein